MAMIATFTTPRIITRSPAITPLGLSTRLWRTGGVESPQYTATGINTEDTPEKGGGEGRKGALGLRLNRFLSCGLCERTGEAPPSSSAKRRGREGGEAVSQIQLPP